MNPTKCIEKLAVEKTASTNICDPFDLNRNEIGS